MTKFTGSAIVVTALLAAGAIHLGEAGTSPAADVPFWQVQGAAPAARDPAGFADLRREARVGTGQVALAEAN
jgi:hypothetical protein